MSILGILADAIMMGENVKLDIDFVREQFPQSNEDYVYCSNAGGSFARPRTAFSAVDSACVRAT